MDNFFDVEQSATFVNTGRFLYNPNQTTSQVSSDLMTGTFPLGFQAILAGTATMGTAQTAVNNTYISGLHPVVSFSPPKKPS